MSVKLNFHRTALLKKARKGFQGYPLATVAFYGPDDLRATKVAVGVIQGDDEAAAAMERWHSTDVDIRRNAQVLEAVLKFVRRPDAKSVAMLETILGCPHEEGIDYPNGEACPKCPFWANRPRPLDTMEAEAADEEFHMPDRRALEKALAELGPRQPGNLQEAQELMWDAWDEREPKRRIALARKALDLCTDCADAYVLLAEEIARSLPEAIALYEEGVRAGERALGKEAFTNNAGHFWGILETRPYIRARTGLAQSLREAGKTDEAIVHFEELMQLNPNDNQGNRDILTACYLETGRDEDALELLNRYPEDIQANWTYTMALLLFRKSKTSAESHRALLSAFEANRHVPSYLLGKKRMPRLLPDHYAFGSPEEAILYADLHSANWRKTPDSLKWLESEARSASGSTPSKPPNRS